MDKLLIQAKSPDEGRGKCVVRLSQESADIIHDLAYKTRRSDREVADTLIAFAAAHVELVPVPLYDLRMPEASA